MNTGQMLITIAALLLLSLVILRINNVFFSTSSVMLDTKFGVLAISLGTSIIEEANSKAFDKATDTTSVSETSGLTTVAILGPEAGEVYPDFNDFDDFNGYVRSTAGDSTFQSAPFYISCQVGYISPANPESFVASQTWHKKINVTVTSLSMKDTIRLSSVFSYWYFR